MGKLKEDTEEFLKEAEELLWTRAIAAEHHARRYETVGADRVRREMRRLYQVKAEAYVDAIAWVRIASELTPVISHAHMNAQEEFAEKIKELDEKVGGNNVSQI